MVISSLFERPNTRQIETFFSIYEPAVKPEGSYARNHQNFDCRNQREVYASKHIIPLGLSSFNILCGLDYIDYFSALAIH